MLVPEIDAFFKERKEGWLKKNIKASMTEQEKLEKEQECKEVFALAYWLPKAAQRAGQMTISTHPCTFSHPSARKNKNGYVTSVIAENKGLNDGFLRTGNVSVDADALGNAAALDVYKFLTLSMPDEQLLLSHIQQKTELVESLLNIPTASFDELRDGFLQMAKADTNDITSSKIKQVYFPTDNDYCLLSVLTHSGHLFELRKRIDSVRFSEESKAARELKKKNEFSDNGFREIYGITTIGYGGTKPQNISVLNNQNAGKAHLLLSTPPELTPRHIRLPKSNFFTETFTRWQCTEIFQAFHKLMETDYNNIKIREGRDFRVQQYVDAVINQMWKLRLFLDDYAGELPTNIPQHQKVWLFPEYQEFRLIEDNWLEKVQEDITQSFTKGYEKTFNNKAVKMGDDLFKHVKAIVSDSKEVLR